MKLKFTLLGQLGQLAGRESLKRTCADNASCEDVLNELAQSHGEAFQSILLTEEGAIRPSVMVLINDHPMDKETTCFLQDGDQITILPAIAGG
jgi:molybdopterin converting factor small subunit